MAVKRMNAAEERISELKDRTIENQFKLEKKKEHGPKKLEDRSIENPNWRT